MHAKWVYIQCINARFPMGVNTPNMFVCFVRFFLMNKTYIFCTLVVVTAYNNHTIHPPRDQRKQGHSYLIHRFLRFFFGFFCFSQVCTIIGFIL